MSHFDEHVAGPVFFDKSFSDVRTFSPDSIILSRRERIDRVLRWLRSCPICRTIRPPIDLVCKTCRDRLLTITNRGEALRQPDYPFPVFSLWTWDEENDPVIRPFVNFFKGGLAVGFAKLATEILACERSPIEAEQICFLHPPGSQTGRHGHAWLLAQSFARLWPETQVQGLHLCGSRHRGESQKNKGLEDRTRLCFVPVSSDKENISRSSGEQTTWVCVDDVITSGATAMAAYMAAGEPARYEVWTLVCRPKLAGKSRF